MNPTVPESRVEALPNGWATAAVTFLHRNGVRETRYEIIDLKTENRYSHESMSITAFKCFELVVGIPLYLATYIGWNLIRMPLIAVGTILVSLARLIAHPNKIQCVQLLKDIAWTAPKRIIEDIWTVVRAPFYAIAMEFAAIYGVFKPVEARKMMGQIERSWHQYSRKHDVRYQDPNLDPLFILKALTDKDFDRTFYIAECMQPYGNLNDPHIVKEETRFLDPGTNLAALVPQPA